MIPEIDLKSLIAQDKGALEQLRLGAEEAGFLTVVNTGLTADDVRRAIAAYRAFFRLPEEEKARVDMARTGANRGWGASRSEQVDPEANPDYKQVFDCGYELPEGDPLRGSGLGYILPRIGMAIAFARWGPISSAARSTSTSRRRAWSHGTGTATCSRAGATASCPGRTKFWTNG